MQWLSKLVVGQCLTVDRMVVGGCLQIVSGALNHDLETQRITFLSYFAQDVTYSNHAAKASDLGWYELAADGGCGITAGTRLPAKEMLPSHLCSKQSGQCAQQRGKGS
jgi:hypothetical protein